MTIGKIIEAAGGESAISEAIDGLTHYAVRKWLKNGIPEKHWMALRGLAPKISIIDLHCANEAARAAKAAA